MRCLHDAEKTRKYCCQRTEYLRRLYRQPQVLFLDEAFDQLDLARERDITEQLKSLDLAIVIVSHRPETVRAVNRVVQMGGAVRA